MSRFLTDLVTRLVCEMDDIHQLEQPLVYQCDLLDMTITVPFGFKTDFASVPRMVGAYLLFGGKGKRASVLHDWAYSGGLNVDRETADLIFREALQATGYSAFTVWTMYQAVRLGGSAHYNAPNVPQPPHVVAAMEAP